MTQEPIQLLATMPEKWLSDLNRLLSETDAHISAFSNWRSALLLLKKKHDIEVILTASILPDATWREVLSFMSHLRCPPQVIVAAHYRDPGLWYEILEKGGYELVVYPFKHNILKNTITSAALEYKLTA